MAKLRVLGASAILIGAVALIGWREAKRPQPAASDSSVRLTPQVVMFVDLSEADLLNDGCAAIIRAVRDAAKRGIVTEEIDTRHPGKRPKHYRLRIAPAVLILDKEGAELRRFEGESPDTVKEIRTELEGLVSPTP